MISPEEIEIRQEQAIEAGFVQSLPYEWQPEVLQDMEDMLDDYEEQECRICGCTDSNACVGLFGETCFWVEEDLCSNCTQLAVIDGIINRRRS